MNMQWMSVRDTEWLTHMFLGHYGAFGFGALAAVGPKTQFQGVRLGDCVLCRAAQGNLWFGGLVPGDSREGRD